MYYKISSETMTSIADAIRAKTGSSNQMTPEQMADAVAGISSAYVSTSTTWYFDITTSVSVVEE